MMVVLESLDGLFGVGLNKTIKQYGAWILSHVLGNRQQEVKQIIS